jgi:SRSO17 transposase
MSRSKWDDTGVMGESQVELSELLSHEEGMLAGDNTSFPKKGNNSVGVARQYCGSTGKVDNCQTGVMLGYASVNGYGIVDYELYMPDKWFDDNHADLRDKCSVQSDIQFRTKNEILLSMIQSTAQSGLFGAKYVGVDSEFGSDSNFLDGLPGELMYFADIRSNQLVFAERPSVSVPAYSGRGRKPQNEKPGISPLPVKEVIEKSKEP